MNDETKTLQPHMHRTYVRRMVETTLDAKKEVAEKIVIDLMVEITPHEYINQAAAGVPASRLLPPEW